MSARTMGQLATDLTDVIGFAITSEKALEWLNARHKLMVARAQALKKTLELTTDGTATIAVPTEVVDVIRLQVAGVRYVPKPRDIIEDLRAGNASISGLGKAYSIEATDAGVESFEVYPTPATGLAVTVLAAVRPDDVLAVGFPIVPDEFADAIVHGAAATGYAYDPEQLQTAQYFEGLFRDACGEYRAWVKRRARGAGPREIRVVGRNA